jgi:hypothetical protein
VFNLLKIFCFFLISFLVLPIVCNATDSADILLGLNKSMFDPAIKPAVQEIVPDLEHCKEATKINQNTVLGTTIGDNSDLKESSCPPAYPLAHSARSILNKTLGVGSGTFYLYCCKAKVRYKSLDAMRDLA